MSNQSLSELISVVVPVYNAREYLGKCLDSILAQDCGAMQIVIVDDGSTDGSAGMADVYAKEHPKTDGRTTWVEVYHIPNGGPSDSRNEALKHIEGRFLICADADDYVPQGAYSGLRDALLAHDVAMAVGQYQVVNEPEQSIREGRVGAPGIYDAPEVKKAIACDNEVFGGGYLWCRMMDRTKLGDLPTFPTDIRIYEDKVWIMELLSQVEKVCVTDVVAYEYYVRTVSTSWGDWHSMDRIRGWNYIATDLNGHGLVTEHFVEEYIYNYMGQFLLLTEYADQAPAWEAFVKHLQDMGVMREGENSCYVDVYTDLLWMIHKKYRLYFLQNWPTYRHMKVLGNLSLKRYVKCALLYAYKVLDRQKEKRELKRSPKSQSKRAFKKYGPLCTPEREALIVEHKKQHLAQQKPVTITFVLQFPETWASLESIYEAALQAGARTLLLCVPKPMNNGDPVYRVNETHANVAYDFLKSLGLPAVNAYKGEQWFDLEAFEPDFVLYTRPYNHHYPKCYQNHTVKAYARTVYIPYAYCMLTSEAYFSAVNYDFMCSTDITFHSNEQARTKTMARLPYQVKNEDHRYVSLGYPRFDTLQKRLDAFEKESTEGVTIGWMPRWLFADVPGQKKSHFLDYYEDMKQYMQEHPQDRLILRPHPLMWESMVDAGVRTKEEMEAIRAEIINAPNMELDSNSDYMPTLMRSDILFADFTSLISEYLVTGRPIIYSDDQDDFDPAAKMIGTGFVNVTNWKETETAIEAIKRGEDPLAEKRREIWQAITPNEVGTIGANIVQYLVDDYEG